MSITAGYTRGVAARTSDDSTSCWTGSGSNSGERPEESLRFFWSGAQTLCSTPADAVGVLVLVVLVSELGTVTVADGTTSNEESVCGGCSPAADAVSDCELLLWAVLDDSCTVNYRV